MELTPPKVLYQVMLSTLLLHWYVHGSDGRTPRVVPCEVWVEMHRGLERESADTLEDMLGDLHTAVCDRFLPELALAGDAPRTPKEQGARHRRGFPTKRQRTCPSPGPNPHSSSDWPKVFSHGSGCTSRGLSSALVFNRHTKHLLLPIIQHYILSSERRLRLTQRLLHFARECPHQLVMPHHPHSPGGALLHMRSWLDPRKPYDILRECTARHQTLPPTRRLHHRAMRLNVSGFFIHEDHAGDTYRHTAFLGALPYHRMPNSLVALAAAQNGDQLASETSNPICLGSIPYTVPTLRHCRALRPQDSRPRHTVLLHQKHARIGIYRGYSLLPPPTLTGEDLVLCH